MLSSRKALHQSGGASVRLVRQTEGQQVYRRDRKRSYGPVDERSTLPGSRCFQLPIASLLLDVVVGKVGLVQSFRISGISDGLPYPILGKIKDSQPAISFSD